MGRLASYETGQRVQKILISALNDHYWKVRAAACGAISNFGTQMAQEGLPILLKLMREGNQSKQVVAETIIAMGPQGEAQLIALIKNHTQNSRLLNNNKAKECIIKALALSNIENPNIDFVIEALFYAYAKEQNATLRRAAIMSLDILHKKSQKL